MDSPDPGVIRAELQAWVAKLATLVEGLSPSRLMGLSIDTPALNEVERASGDVDQLLTAFHNRVASLAQVQTSEVGWPDLFQPDEEREAT